MSQVRRRLMRCRLEDIPEQISELIGTVDRVCFPVQGLTSHVLIVSGSRGEYVVKRASKPPFNLWLRRENQVLRSLVTSGLPVPRPYLYLEESAGDRAHWLVMERLPGIPLKARLRDEHDCLLRRRLMFGFGRLLAAIHNAAPPNALTCPEPWLDMMLDQATQNLQRYDVDGTPALLSLLKSQRPKPVSNTLIHGDYTLDNVLVMGETLTGVIDWCSGAVGDPRYDLALATRPEREAFQDPADLDAFYEGYGGPRLAREESTYFEGLYEFF